MVLFLFFLFLVTLVTFIYKKFPQIPLYRIFMSLYGMNIYNIGFRKSGSCILAMLLLKWVFNQWIHWGFVFNLRPLDNTPLYSDSIHNHHNEDGLKALKHFLNAWLEKNPLIDVLLGLSELVLTLNCFNLNEILLLD